jgi:hypothetical protein
MNEKTVVVVVEVEERHRLRLILVAAYAKHGLKLSLRALQCRKNETKTRMRALSVVQKKEDAQG